jgi:L-threonine kinase
MRRVKVRTPGTCGEFIQGWFAGNPCLVSSPIDRYSRMTIEEGQGNLKLLKPKTVAMIEAMFRRYGISKAERDRLHISMASEIPLEKGMASSTADLAGMAAGLSEYFGLGLTPEEIGAICTAIEPSDNLMFPKLNLFNHIDGRVLKSFDGCVEADLLIIDFHGGIDTMSFNETQDDYSKKDLETFAEIVEQFENGVKTKNLSDIGEACTKSAFLNQKRLKKPYLEKLAELSRAFGGLGTVIGHSGTVIGIMHEKAYFQEQGFRAAFKEQIPETAYSKIYCNHLIPGGIEVSREED